ncbi:MerR family transcriptional regulator [Pseudoalteromonas sp. HM-SA03]|uniref:helix-turn-helix domain-containing protein n=1 Tax=Pseudoalteromonas sp. HM-SA03 TaxID=2029678 RepID=UPI000BAE2CF7|nr:helix-turn-helix domain-containing protein [Pseudoalteromonas sp. HM-SA03]PAY02029.1 MerR family transcriptional regulator [Pseudoalteromonas sp. HM-SA03]
MDISEVAKKSGLPASTLRYYEEKGLIRSIGRQGLKRVFPPSILERLALITLGRNAGFSLDEIADMFTPEGKAEIDRMKLQSKADELNETINHLTAMRDGLYHAAKCPAPSHFECPTFKKLLKRAEKARPNK